MGWPKPINSIIYIYIIYVIHIYNEFITGYQWHNVTWCQPNRETWHISTIFFNNQTWRIRDLRSPVGSELVTSSKNQFRVILQDSSQKWLLVLCIGIELGMGQLEFPLKLPFVALKNTNLGPSCFRAQGTYLKTYRWVLTHDQFIAWKANPERFTIWLWLTVRHGKSPTINGGFYAGKIIELSIGAIWLPWRSVSHNQAGYSINYLLNISHF